MNTIQFQGHHSRIPHADVTLLPDAEHTLWQAWRLPSGNYIIQALTDEKRPEGVTYLLQGDIFPQVLTPLLATISSTTKASAPNIITMWYNEVASLKGTDLYGPPIVEYDNFTMPPLHPETLIAIESAKALEEGDTSLTAPCPPSAYDNEKPRIRQLGSVAPETTLTPHSGTAIPSVPGNETDQGSAISTAQEFTDSQIVSQSVSQGAPQTAPQATSTTVAETTKDDAPSKAKELQSPATGPQTTISGAPYPHAMEEAIQALASNELAPPQIDDFFKRLLEEAEHPLEEHIARLIAIPAQENNTAYQAVLTELGLVLRQKKQYTLAKQCHLRALELTPLDERILFNIARTEYEAGNIKAAQDYLSRCLALAPDFNVAKNFLAFISAGS